MRNSLLALASVFALAGAASTAFAENPTARFRVTVTNVTAGNVLSPFVAASLARGAGLFRLNQAPSAGLAQLAETGNASGLLDELRMRSDLQTVTQASGGAILAGEARSVVLELAPEVLHGGASLQIAAMIGRSNDSFIAIDPVDLRALTPGGRFSIEATNFDAGSEENTGNVADFGSGGHPTEFAEGRVTYDRGLNPRGDAPEIWAWSRVAAIVTIERL